MVVAASLKNVHLAKACEVSFTRLETVTCKTLSDIVSWSASWPWLGLLFFLVARGGRLAWRVRDEKELRHH